MPAENAIKETLALLDQNETRGSGLLNLMTVARQGTDHHQVIFDKIVEFDFQELNNDTEKHRMASLIATIGKSSEMLAVQAVDALGGFLELAVDMPGPGSNAFSVQDACRHIGRITDENLSARNKAIEVVGRRFTSKSAEVLLGAFERIVSNDELAIEAIKAIDELFQSGYIENMGLAGINSIENIVQQHPGAAESADNILKSLMDNKLTKGDVSLKITSMRAQSLLAHDSAYDGNVNGPKAREALSKALTGFFNAMAAQTPQGIIQPGSVPQDISGVAEILANAQAVFEQLDAEGVDLNLFSSWVSQQYGNDAFWQSKNDALAGLEASPDA